MQNFQTNCSKEAQMNGYTKTVYVVQGRAWWGFSAQEWIAFFPLALAGVRSGEGYKLPKKNRLNGRPKCAQRMDGEDAWYSDPNDAEIFYLPVSYTHLRAHETRHDLVCRLLLEKKK